MADVVVTASAVSPGIGASLDRGLARATLEAGDALYKDPTDEKWGLADANGGDAAANCGGFAKHPSRANQPIEVHTGGPLVLGTSPLTPGATYFLSAAAGKICPAADLAPGMKTVVVGMAVSASTLQVALQKSGVTL
jgi:hypothetical protein